MSLNIFFKKNRILVKSVFAVFLFFDDSLLLLHLNRYDSTINTKLKLLLILENNLSSSMTNPACYVEFVTYSTCCKFKKYSLGILLKANWCPKFLIPSIISASNGSHSQLTLFHRNISLRAIFLLLQNAIEKKVLRIISY